MCPFYFILTPLPPLVPGRTDAGLEDFKLNMASPTASHMVGRCFVATEEGTYFKGSGYLKAGQLTQLLLLLSSMKQL